MLYLVSMKFCNGCNNFLALDRFTKNNSKSDGLQSRCKTCRAEYARQWYSDPSNKEVHKERSKRVKQERRIEYEQMVLVRLQGGCVDCGEIDPVVLQFDHLDPSTKKFNISEVFSRQPSYDVFEEELDKCVVRCANCHIRKTATDFGWWRTKLET